VELHSKIDHNYLTLLLKPVSAFGLDNHRPLENLKMTDLSRAGRAVRYNGTIYRSVTEARWAIFFTFLEIEFEYEPETISLDNGQSYLPDFSLKISAGGEPDPITGAITRYSPVWFEVKPDHDGTIVGEADRPLAFSRMQGGNAVWIASGPPSKETRNILRLERLGKNSLVQETANHDNYWQFLEDRRDERVYWIVREYEGDCIGGPGISTDHDKFPIMGSNIERAYNESATTRF
jgi:hypothetical protein